MTWPDIEARAQDIIRGVFSGGSIPADARLLIRTLIYRLAYLELAVEELGVQPFNPGGIKQ